MKILVVTEILPLPGRPEAATLTVPAVLAGRQDLWLLGCIAGPGGGGVAARTLGTVHWSELAPSAANAVPCRAASIGGYRVRLRRVIREHSFDLVVIEGARLGGCVRAIPEPLRRRTVWHLCDLAPRQPFPVPVGDGGAPLVGMLAMLPRLRAALQLQRLRALAGEFLHLTAASPQDLELVRQASPCLLPRLMPVRFGAQAAPPPRAGPDAVATASVPPEVVQADAKANAAASERVLERLCAIARRPAAIPGRPGRPIGHWWLG